MAQQNGDTDCPMRVDGALLRELAELLSANELTEIEVEDGDRKIRVRREAAPVMAYAPAPALAPGLAAAPGPQAAPAAEAAPVAPVDAVKSPMVGTFYRSATPGSDPFVQIGSVVKVGEPVCIIEAMKIMNEIETDAAGTIKEILCENGQAVEFGQPLFIIE